MLYDKFNEVIIAEHSGDIPPAFIYRFTYIPTGQWYRGYHGLKQHESPFDGTYWNSSKDEEFQRLLEEEPENFKYEITHYGSVTEMIALEHKLLKEERSTPEGKKLSWNQWNGIEPEGIELPDLKYIDKLANDAYDKDSDLAREMVDYSDLGHLIRFQVRFETNKSHSKIHDYKNTMNSRGSTKGFTITVVTFDGHEILVGGNHTLEALRQSNCTKIEVVYIHANMDMQTLNALGNALNKRKEIERMTTSVDDCAVKLVDLVKTKKITDLKSKYVTEYIKVTGGFEGTWITKTRKKAEEMLKEEGSWKKGKTWINWKTNERKKEKANLETAHTNDTTFAMSQSAHFRADRVIEEYLEDLDARKKLGLPPRNIIKVLMWYDLKKTFDEYNNNNPQPGHRRIIEGVMKSEGVESPSVIFENLEFYEDEIK